MSISVGLAWHGSLLKDTHFTGPLEQEANYLSGNPNYQNQF